MSSTFFVSKKSRRARLERCDAQKHGEDGGARRPRDMPHGCALLVRVQAGASPHACLRVRARVCVSGRIRPEPGYGCQQRRVRDARGHQDADGRGQTPVAPLSSLAAGRIFLQRRASAHTTVRAWQAVRKAVRKARTPLCVPSALIAL